MNGVHSLGVSSLVYLGQGFVASASVDKKIHVWDIALGKKVQTIEGHTGTITCMVRVGANELYTSGADESILRWKFSE